jgi:hypothetical protein
MAQPLHKKKRHRQRKQRGKNRTNDVEFGNITKLLESHGEELSMDEL